MLPGHGAEVGVTVVVAAQKATLSLAVFLALLLLSSVRQKGCSPEAESRSLLCQLSIGGV